MGWIKVKQIWQPWKYMGVCLVHTPGTSISLCIIRSQKQFYFVQFLNVIFHVTSITNLLMQANCYCCLCDLLLTYSHLHIFLWTFQCFQIYTPDGSTMSIKKININNLALWYICLWCCSWHFTFIVYAWLSDVFTIRIANSLTLLVALSSLAQMS